MALLLLSILVPAAAGILLPVLRLKDRRLQNIFVICALSAELLLVILLCLQQEVSCTLFAMTALLSVKLKLVCYGLFSILFGGYLLAGIFAVKYLDREEKAGSLPESAFWSFFSDLPGRADGHGSVRQPDRHVFLL